MMSVRKSQKVEYKIDSENRLLITLYYFRRGLAKLCQFDNLLIVLKNLPIISFGGLGHLCLVRLDLDYNVGQTIYAT